jgi:hypothetical protein
MNWLSIQRPKASVVPNVVSLTDDTTIAIDASLGQQFSVTLGGNRTLENPTNAENGQLLLFIIRQDGTGGRTLTADTKFRFPESFDAFEISDVANSVSYIGVRYHQSDDSFDVLDIKAGYV